MVAEAMGGILQKEWNLPALVDFACTDGNDLPWWTLLALVGMACPGGLCLHWWAWPSATFVLSGPPAYGMVLPTFASFSVICD